MSKRREQRAKQADEIAREAARLLSLGQAADMAEALRLATESRGDDRIRPPSPLRVRKHAQAMSMQAMGEAEYERQRRAWLELAEDLMSTLETALPECETLLAGRAADGHFDGDPAIHIRVYAQQTIAEIASALATFGYDAPAATFPIMESKGAAGRLSQMQWVEEGARIVLTRCPQRIAFDSRDDLVTGKPITILTLEQLRQRLAG